MNKKSCFGVVLYFILFFSLHSYANETSINTTIIPFKNNTGDTSLDWLSVGLQDAMTVDLWYLKSFETKSLSALPGTLRSLQTMSIAQILEYAKKELKDVGVEHVWYGEYDNKQNAIYLNIFIVDVQSEKLIIKHSIQAHINELLKQSSEAILAIADKLGLSVDEEEKQRVLSKKTSLVDAWKMNSEGFAYQIKYYDEEDKTAKDAIITKWRDTLVNAIRIDPSYAEALNNLGWFLITIEEVEKAGEAFEKALDNKPYLVDASIGMGYVFNENKQYVKAHEYYQKGVNLNPTLTSHQSYLLQVLVKLKREEESRTLSFKLLNSKSEMARYHAAKALETFGNKSDISVLLEVLNNDHEELVRMQSAISLGEIASGSAFDVDLDKNNVMLVPSLINALKDEDKYVRFGCAGALGEIGNRTAIPALRETLKKDPYEKVRFNAAKALGKLGDKQAIPILIEIFKKSEQSSGWRRDAIETMDSIGSPEVLPILIEALKDKSAIVRYQAIVSLDNIEDITTAFSALIERLNDNSKLIRENAAALLGGLKDENALPYLIKALNDEEFDVRQASAHAIKKIFKHTNKTMPYDINKKVEEQKDTKSSGLNNLSNRAKSVILSRVLDLARKYYSEKLKNSIVYKRFQETLNFNLFNTIRKNLMFIDNYDSMIHSDNFLSAFSGYYLLSLFSREEGKYEEQLIYSVKSLRYINPEYETALTILSLWLKAQAELKLDRKQTALETIEYAESLIDNLSKREKKDFEEAFHATTLFIKGEILSSLSEADTAIKAYQHALKQIESESMYFRHREENKQKFEAMVLTSLGILQVHKGRENLQQAILLGQDHETVNSIEMENEEKRYIEMSKQRIAEGDYEEAQSLLEELHLRQHRYINRRTVLKLADFEKQQYIDEYHQKENKIKALTQKIEELSKSEQENQDLIKQFEHKRSQSKRELKTYLSRLQKEQPDIAALLGAKPIELAAVQEQIPENTLLLQYLLLRDKLTIFGIKTSTIDITEVPINQEKLTELVKALRVAILSSPNKKNKQGKTYREVVHEIGRSLYNYLIQPISEKGYFKGIKQLCISPNSILHYLPFEALLDSQNQYLDASYSVSYINSTSILWVAMNRYASGISKKTHFVGFSNPDGSLPYTNTEVQNIAELFTSPSLYINENAKKSVLQTVDFSRAFLHLATHGKFRTDKSTESYLIMADGKLTIQEIWGLPLKGLLLTTLSACQTGVGEIMSGDDLITLETSFIYAGSPSVISTLWQVDDQATSDLMRLFYEHLLDGMTKADALVSAKREFRAQKEAYNHPYYWAAFTLRGVWQ